MAEAAAEEAAQLPTVATAEPAATALQSLLEPLEEPEPEGWPILVLVQAAVVQAAEPLPRAEVEAAAA